MTDYFYREEFIFEVPWTDLWLMMMYGSVIWFLAACWYDKAYSFAQKSIIL